MFVKIENLRFKYKNSKGDTIKNFALNIEKGEIISILGESGSGKSTVLRIIAGLEVNASGSIKINDKVVLDEKTFVMPEKRGVGMVFQDYALFPHMTVTENIQFGLKGFSKKEKQERLMEMLELVSLKDFEKRYPYELSGGQQQRVAIARALAPRPALFLLDEPFSNLDADLRSKIREEIKIILRQTGTTSIFVTHDKEDARALADRIVVVKDGHVIRSGKVNEILTS
jgi:iron(III) transport system ATP-binding protein